MTSEETKEFYSETVENTSHTNTTIPLTFIEWTSRCEELLYFFGSHKAAGTLRENKFLDTSFNYCKQLFSRDGDIVIIDNYGKQELCDSYPIKIILQKSFVTHIEKNNHDTTDNTCSYDYLCRLIERARYARVHRRFVVPVIFLPNNACIARSSTLSTTGELLLNKATTVVSEALNYCPNSMESPMGHDLNALRAADIKLLKYFNIKFIADLMVEDKKKVGWGRYALTVTSSEKVDREQRYRDFNISSIPYPGCEFFKRYKDNNHNATNLVFEWDRDIHDAKLNLHWLNNNINNDRNSNINNNTNNSNMINDIIWNEYETWDIITLTQNYLRLILDYIQSSFNSVNDLNSDNGMGLLIHCISGWDRTPLFVSLIRLSLWADGIIHCDLDSAEILYLTLSYDWLLFTHQFGNRLIKGEDIFHFTFYVIQYICNQKYSIWHGQNTHLHLLLQNKQNITTKPTNHTNGHGNKTQQILQKVKKLSQMTKEQTKKISKATKQSSNKLLSKLKSRSSTNVLSKYMNTNHFDTNTNVMEVSDSSIEYNNNSNIYMDNTPFSPPIQIANPMGPKSKSVNIHSRNKRENNIHNIHHTVINTSNINPLHTNTNINTNILSHSWESKGCGPLSSTIRHAYIPTLLTPPSFTKNRNILPNSLSVNGNHSNNNHSNVSSESSQSIYIPPSNPLQLVRTQPTGAVHTTNITPRNAQNAQSTNSRNLRNFSWQFVDQNSPMFQFISTPKSDPPTHQNHNMAPPELNLGNTNEIHNNNNTDDISSNSSGDIKINTKYSLSAPSSTKRNHSFLNFGDLLLNATPSPEIIAHPETNIIDMHDDDTNRPNIRTLDNINNMMESMSKEEENQLERTLSTSSLDHRDVKSETHNINHMDHNIAAHDIAKALVDDVIQNVMCDNINTNTYTNTNRTRSSNYILNTMTSAKSTPVTISDFLGLNGIGVRDSISHAKKHESLSENNLKDLSELPSLKKVDSFEINVDDVLQPMDQHFEKNNNNNNNNVFCLRDNGRLIGRNRSDRLMQVYTLFNKIYTQVMIIDDPPSFYKQSVQINNDFDDFNDGDNIDFISSDKYNASYFTNQQSDPYNNIATYLKSILPASLIGNHTNNIHDEYDDDD